LHFLKKQHRRSNKNNATIKPQALDLAGLEAMTQDIIQKIISARSHGSNKITLLTGYIIECPGTMQVTDGELRRARRQYFNYIKQQHTFGHKQSDHQQLFIKYLASTL